MDKLHSLALILIMAALTAALRFLPFVMFSKGTPKTIVYLGNLLPNAIMAMLVVYCLKNVSFTASSHGIPEALAVFLVAVLHKWKHNMLLSILGGTAAYMLLVQAVF
ncbi:MAG: AzlD domain-containing protein [Subdoligranulum sp.]|nr:AzlD domain-containing protein [Subdoligranulum sp.]MCI7543066.1 AzlD domain-containing protein [Subdoligranulum sp.]MDY5923461.1 AzlD domain-containing protein [Oscillospiraceae bacterium]